MMGDENMIRAVAAGSDKALRELFDRHAPWIHRSLPSSAVGDVLQETFIAVWRGAGGYKSDGEAGA